MLSKAIRQFAEANNLKKAKDYVYGSYRGYMTLVGDGGFTIAVRFPDEETKNQLLTFVNDKALLKKYKLSRVEVDVNSVVVLTLGNLKKMLEFMDVLYTKLEELSCLGMTHCSACGMEILDGQGVTATLNNYIYYLHDGCFRRDSDALIHMHEERKKTGSIFTGIIGALLGATIGAIPWAIASYNGWFMAILGLLIGFLANKGYELCKGRENMAKGIILIFATIFGVFLGEFSALVFAVYTAWGQDPAYVQEGFTVMEVVWSLFYALGHDSELLLNVLSDMVMGLFFALLGFYPTLALIFRSVGKRGNTLTKLD